MSFAAIRTWWELRTNWEKTALVIWSAVLLFVSVRAFCWPESKTVYPIFSYSSRLWWSSLDLFEPGRPKWLQHVIRHQPHDREEPEVISYPPEKVQNGYRYSPTFAILMTPLAVLPDRVGGVLWRLVSAAALLAAFTWLARSVFPQALSRDRFACLVLCSLPLALQSLSNGQANVVVVACMLATVAAVKDERWNLASVMIALAFICKVYPLALGLLLLVLYPRRLGWRMSVAIGAGLLMPFLFQDPSYVVDQYEKWFDVLRSDDRSAIDVEQAYRDLWLLVRLYGIPLPHLLYTIMQVAAGAGIALLTWNRQRGGWPEQALLTSTLALAASWMMLLGPATESSSFILLAPSFAWSVIEASQPGPLQYRRGLLWLSAALFVAAVVLGGFSQTVKIHARGVHSWATLLYFAYLLLERKPAPATAAMRQVREDERRQAA